MAKHLDLAFPAIVLPICTLRRILVADPFAEFALTPEHKRVVTFLARQPRPAPKLPIEQEGARILCRKGLEAFTVYLPGRRGPVFMTLIEKTFGKDVTTRTWQTVEKVAR